MPSIDYYMGSGLGTADWQTGGLPSTAGSTGTGTTSAGSTSIWNVLIPTLGSVATSIFGKQPSTTVVSGGGSTSTTGTVPVVVTGNGVGVIPTASSLSSLTTKAWFWPVVIILGVVLLFGKKIRRMIR